MLPPVIAVIGDIGAGKSSVARVLVLRSQYKRLPFAARLKGMLLSLGLTDADVNGNLKEVPSELLLGQTPRKAMQALGTEWGRKCIGSDFWISLWKRDVSTAGAVVVDDMRFPNEYDAVRELGGLVIRVVRPSQTFNTDTHESEAYQRSMRADFEVINDGTLDDLYDTVGDLIWRIKESKSAGISAVATAAE